MMVLEVLKELKVLNVLKVLKVLIMLMVLLVCIEFGKILIALKTMALPWPRGKRRWPCPGLEGSDDGLALA